MPRSPTVARLTVRSPVRGRQDSDTASPSASTKAALLTKSGGARGTAYTAPRSDDYDDPAPAIPPHHSDDDDELARSAAGESAASSEFTDMSASTGASTGDRAAREAGTTRLKLCGRKIRVSFVVWTFLAMMIPIGFLVGSTAAAATSSLIEMARIRHHIDMVTAGSNCVTAISEEHARSLRYILEQNNESLSDMTARRLQFHVDCTLAFQTELLLVRAENAHFADAFDSWALSSREIAVMRDRIDGLVTLTDAERAQYNAELQRAFDGTSRSVTNALTLPADLIKTAAARFFLNVKLLADARKSLWTAVASTLSLAGADPTAAATAQDLVRAQADIAAAHSVLRSMKGIASQELRDANVEWSQEATTVRLFDVFNNLAQRFASLNREVFFTVAQTALDSLREVEREQVEHARRSQTVAAKITTNLALLCSGALICIVAGSLLAWQQLRTKADLENQVMRAERTRRAVSAFVPKFFLHKMGYTSITQVEVGESTDVALAMMFSDIRKFATVSEGMESSELFDWVQGYFQRMTTIIERGEGNISQFTGDSLFAVFSSCRAAVTCAIDMQAEAQELNIDRLCREQNSVPIEIGVGLHHDVLAMGILGDDGRHTVTAISASVNLASRLQGLTKQLGCRILASDAVIDQLSVQDRANASDVWEEDFLIRRVGPAMVKGSGKPVTIFDIYQSDDRAMQHYKTETKAMFEQYAKLMLIPFDDLDPSLPHPDDLGAALKAKARAMGVVDPMTDHIAGFRTADGGSMSFDEK